MERERVNVQSVADLSAVDLATLRRLPDYLLARDIATGVKDGWDFCRLNGRWLAWYDQIDRSSQSVALNVAEAFGKGRGYFLNAYLIARGEAFETAAALEIGPPEIAAPLLPLADDLVRAMNRRLSELQAASDPQDGPSGSDPFAPPAGRTEECRLWLAAQLASGPQPVGHLRSGVQSAGFSTATLYRARLLLGIREFHAHGRKHWCLLGPVEEVVGNVRA